MKTVILSTLTFLVCVGSSSVQAAVPEKNAKPATKPAEEYQDFVFLTDVRPLLIRVHVSLDGKSLRAASDELFAYVFRYLDRDGDGFLTKDEVERVPTLTQLLGGAIVANVGGGGGGAGRPKGQEPVPPTLAELDTNKDGKVSVEELAAYYRKSGFVQFQFHFEQTRAGGFNIAKILGGGRSEPTLEAVRTEIFSVLDTNNDGKLSKAELSVISAVLLKRDEDDDEMITAKELVINGPAENPLAGFGMMGMGRGGAKKDTVQDSRLLVPVHANGSTAGLVRRLKERYAKDDKVTQKQVGLDPAAFTALDTNKDGSLDDKELAGFAGRTPDLELNLRMGSKNVEQNRIEIIAGKGSGALLTSQLAIKNDRLWVDLGLSRGELQLDEVEQPTEQFTEIIKQQIVLQFKQADSENKGFLDEKQAKGNRVFGNLFKMVDRDNDGKITEKEVVAFFEEYLKIQAKAQASVTLSITDESRGLFDIVDADRDNKLSLREMRQGTKIFDQLDKAGKGFLTQDDIPRTYRITIQRGSANSLSRGAAAAFASLYSGNYATEQRHVSTAGPAWFRKMDHNGDGDVSRREFLGSSEQFHKIDTDGDGLISVEEAIRFDKLVRQLESK
jgi:Ca2+-binding EF-hand superfamily protein